jgi:enoyl-CoA hydratase/carnithine racemase
LAGSIIPEASGMVSKSMLSATDSGNDEMTSDTQYEFILTDRPMDSVLRITLNRPQKRNALNNELRGELFDALERADNDDTVRVMVLRGAGSCFSSGYDLTAVRLMSPPDNQCYPWLMGMKRAMELMLTGDSITGTQAAEWGFANRAFPIAELEAGVLAMAERVAKVPAALLQLNKRAVHRQMEAMGMRNGLRAGTEVQALASLVPEVQAYIASLRQNITSALNQRDGQFGDYRTQARK